ncbi:6147_t:CDS:2, partial [Acaulospora morrowiae]
QPQTILKLDKPKNLGKKQRLPQTHTDFIIHPKKNTHGKITMELQHELITFGCLQIQTGDDQIIPHNTSLKTNAFNNKATKAKQWKLFQENLDKKIEWQEELHNTTHMSVERLWNITWNSICTAAKRHVRKANPKKTPHANKEKTTPNHTISTKISAQFITLRNLYI